MNTYLFLEYLGVIEWNEPDKNLNFDSRNSYSEPRYIPPNAQRPLIEISFALEMISVLLNPYKLFCNSFYFLKFIWSSSYSHL